jgi:uncharacterized protein (TIGR03086 family)
MNPKDLEKAFASTGAVLSGVSRDQLSDSTPCTSWQVRELVNHIVGGTTYFASVAETGSPPEGGGEGLDYAAGDDYVAQFNKGAARAVEAFAAEGAMERIMHLPFGDLPGSVFINIAAVDTFTHGWDLAKATGQPSDLDPALATELLGLAQGFVPDNLRGPEGMAPFGPKVEPSAAATPAEKLAAFLGRHP